MTTRVVKLKLLTQQDVITVKTSARTRGELCSELSSYGINWGSVKLIDRATHDTYELDEAVLPAIDCLLFVVPIKTKSGVDLSYREVKEKIKEYKENGGDVPFNYTHATTEELNGFWNSITKKPMKSATKTITKNSDNVVIKNSEAIEKNTLVDYTTKKELQAEVEDLARRVK